MKKTKILFIKSTVSAFIFILIFLLGLFPGLVQKYYSTGIYPSISAALRFISSVFPFALGDLLYVVLILFILYRIFRFYKRRQKLKKQDRIKIPLQVLNFFLAVYIVFKIVWGLNYSRPGINKALGIGNKKYNVKELVLLGNYFVTKTNALKLETIKVGPYPSYTLANLREKSVEAYNHMESKNLLFRYQNPSFKAVTSSWLTSKLGIEGYYAPLSGEANLNMALPDFVKPYVSCHEIGHQLGIAYEDEANLLGFLTASQSRDVHYRYSAYYEMLRYILFEIRIKSPQDYKRLYNQLLPQVLADFKTEKAFWKQYNGDMFGYMDAAFDRFLKLNNQKKGIDSYQDIVIWLWNMYSKQLAVSN